MLGQRCHVCAILQQRQMTLSNAMQQRPCQQCCTLHALPAVHTSDGVGLVRSSTQSRVSRMLVPNLVASDARGPYCFSAQTALRTDMAPLPRHVQDPSAPASCSQPRTPLRQRGLADPSVPARPELDGGHALRALQLLQEGQCPRLQVRACSSTLAHRMLPQRERWGLPGCLTAKHVCNKATTGAGPS